MTEPVARKMWRTLEPYHGTIYFVPEADEAYRDLGLEGRMGYFASRSAAMGPVPADVVVATFFNFFPGLVRRSIPEAWRRASPERILEARRTAAHAALRRLLGEDVASDECREAASLAREAAGACAPAGRPLFAAHASLEWPDEPHLVLWNAITLLREFRGDGHVAALTAAGVSPCEALVLHGASGEVPPAVLKRSRAWPDAEWEDACRRLRDRGWLTDDGSLTDEGRQRRADTEARTDALASAPWEQLGEDASARLRRLVRPWSKRIVESGTFSVEALSDG